MAQKSVALSWAIYNSNTNWWIAPNGLEICFWWAYSFACDAFFMPFG
jgi:hypothetical protein